MRRVHIRDASPSTAVAPKVVAARTRLTRMTTERLVDELLFWALDASGGDTTCDLGPHTGVDPSRLPFPNEEAVQRAASALEVQGWARGFRNAAGDVLFFRLTSVGVQEAGRRRKAIASRRERLVYAEDALLTWVFETAEVGRPVELMDFINSPANSFYGSELTVEEVDAASRNLVGLKMLSTTGGPLLSPSDWVDGGLQPRVSQVLARKACSGTAPGRPMSRRSKGLSNRCTTGAKGHILRDVRPAGAGLCAAAGRPPGTAHPPGSCGGSGRQR